MLNVAVTHNFHVQTHKQMRLRVPSTFEVFLLLPFYYLGNAYGIRGCEPYPSLELGIALYRR
jgi:hypothetical protein